MGLASHLWSSARGQSLRSEGFQTKREVCKWIVENSKSGRTLLGGAAIRLCEAISGARREPFASLAKLPKDALIAPRHSPDDINILVVGGETNPMWITTDFIYTRSAAVDKWRPKCGIAVTQSRCAAAAVTCKMACAVSVECADRRSEPSGRRP